MNWSASDLEILRAQYPKVGAVGVAPLLSVQRTHRQIMAAANRRGLSCGQFGKNNRTPWRKWRGPQELNRAEAQREISK